MKKSRYDQLPFAESFSAFEQQRTDLLALLRSVSPEAWERAALVRVGDRERPLTLQARVWVMTSHEAVHCTQMEEAAAAVRPSG